MSGKMAPTSANRQPLRVVFVKGKAAAAFFPDGQWKSNFLVNLGYGDPAGLFPRSPRLAFEEACRIE